MIDRNLIAAACAGVILSFVVNARAEAPAYNIYELQHSDAAHDWKSLHEGEIVQCVGGIVTHKFKLRIVLQDPTLGSEWSAIEVRGRPVYPVGLEVGDEVDFDSVYVDEYSGVTTLQYYNASRYTVHSSGNPIPDPVGLSLWDIRYPARPEDSEKYAAVLVSMDEGLTIGAMDLGKADDNYELIGVSGDTAWASDYANGEIDTATYYVSPGDCYQRMVGILQRYTSDTWDYYQLLPRGAEDYVPCLGSVGEGTNTIPEGISLGSGFPNPFNPSTVIPFSLSRRSPVRISVFDIHGRRVAVLIDDTYGPGRYEIGWDGTDREGDPLSSGVLLVRLESEGRILTGKLCLVR